MRYLLFALLLMSSPLIAHEMTPTYPEFRPSHLNNVYKTTMQMFNKRQDVEYYEIGVFDEKWNSIPFVSAYNIFKIPYLDQVMFDVYVRKTDVDNVKYICSVSKLRKDTKVRTAVASKICSKVK